MVSMDFTPRSRRITNFLYSWREDSGLRLDEGSPAGNAPLHSRRVEFLQDVPSPEVSMQCCGRTCKPAILNICARSGCAVCGCAELQSLVQQLQSLRLLACWRLCLLSFSKACRAGASTVLG